MRSNIIQMLLNASSGKRGGSDPIKPDQPSQPESEWTVVHFLMNNTCSVNCITFKTKEGKWYYGTELRWANSGYPNYTNFATGFGELLPWQSNAFGATYGSSYTLKKDTLDAVDPKGRPLLFAITGQNRDNYLFEGIFSVEDAKYYKSFTSNRWPTCTLPDGNTFTGWVLSVGIKVPTSKLDSVTIKLASLSSGDDQYNLYVIQDKNPDPKGQLAKFLNWTVWTKTDFSKDRLIKHIEYSKNINLYSETDDFGLTIQ